MPQPCQFQLSWVSKDEGALWLAMDNPRQASRPGCFPSLPPEPTYFFICPYGVGRLWNVKNIFLQSESRREGPWGTRLTQAFHCWESHMDYV
ncbi:uncharacterized protein PHA67_003124 isoform 8-T10 [Liasis olivaceus]